MKAVKYYYSEALQLRTLRVLTDAKGDVKIILPSVPEHIKDLPRVTVCSLYDSVENKVRYGVAVCSSKDHFSRKEARRISLERAKIKPSRIIILKKESNLGKISKRIVNEIFESKLKNVRKLCEV